MKKFFDPPKIKPIPPGVYHMQSAAIDEPPYRLHLRLQNDGSGVLVVNASTIMHLNPTAAEYAWHVIQGTDAASAAQQVAERYRVSRGKALNDFEDFATRIETLVSGQDVDPVAYLEFDRVAPHSASLTAPLRVDCALTYRQSPGADPASAPTKRVDREFSTHEWKHVLDMLWEQGVPHVTFTGGEPTLRDDLIPLVQHAESTGQVCGLLTDGLKLADRGYLDQVLMSGLDHIMMILHASSAESWHALEMLIPEDVFVTAHLTIDRETVANAPAHLERLAALGLKALSLSFTGPDLPASALADRAADLGLELKYDLPVPYSADNPIARETAEDAAPDGAGHAWLYIEPDGDVLPAQGQASGLRGNILRDPWTRIYPT